MMQEIFTLVGIVCALLICGGIAAAGLGFVLNAWQDSYYRGLRSQIADTVSSLAEHYEPHENMESCDVRRILIDLNRRHWPSIEDIKGNQKLRDDRKKQTDV